MKLRGLAVLILLLSTTPAISQAKPAEVRFICLAPSPYTSRHDTLRAGLGIYLRLQKLIEENKLPVKATFYDGIPTLENPPKASALLRHADVILVGSATWSQGSSYHLRRFFELTGGESLAGVAVSAWTAAGGFHTGGEQAILDTLRSLMGQGGEAFTLGQKLMVFSTDERVDIPPGDFSTLDCWYMDQFARNIALVAVARGDRAKAREWAVKLGVSHTYYRALPSSQELVQRFGGCAKELNAAGDPKSEAYKSLTSRISGK